MEAAPTATSYPAGPGVAGHRTATAGSSVTVNATKVRIHSFETAVCADASCSLQSHDGSITYMTIDGGPTVPVSLRGPFDIPGGFRVVCAGAATAVVGYTPLA